MVCQMIKNMLIINIWILLTLEKYTCIMHQQDIIFHLQNGRTFHIVSCYDSFPWNIVITTKCSGWGSSYVFIKFQKSDHSKQSNDLPQIIPHLVIKKHILSRRPYRDFFSYFFSFPQSFFDMLDLPNQLIRSNGRGDPFFVC